MKINVDKSAKVFCEKTITIHVKPEIVWKVISDIQNWNKWNESIRIIHCEQELNSKSKFQWKANGLKITSQIHTFIPNSEIGWTGKVLSLKAVHNWKLKEVSNGTEVSVEESVSGFLCSLFRKSLNKTFNKEMEKSVFLLKKYCEENVENI